MVRHRSSYQHAAALAAVVFLALPGCGGDSGESPTETDTGTVAGAILDPSDQGVAGAALTLSRSGQPSRTASSGSDGSFTFQNVEVGTWSLAVEAPDGFELAPGQSAQQSVTVTSGGTVQATFRVTPVAGEGTISGTVLHDGRGVGQVELTLDDGQGGVTEVTTDASGTFTFDDVEPGDYELEISPPAYFQMATGEDLVRSVSVEAGEGTTVQVLLAPVTAQQTHDVQLGETSFTPNQLTVAPGARIRWVNQNDIQHTITPDGHSAWTRQALSTEGQTFEVVLNNPGDYSYFCEPHQALGMTGSVTVQP